MSEYITIHTRSGAFRAYLARPKLASAPSVVVLHEVFGVNDDMRQTCDELAAAGFIAVCPDLFWRQAPGVDLSVTSSADWNVGLALYTAYDRNAGIVDVVETLRVAALLDGASGKVATVGYCLGGLMAFLTAARSKVDAAVAYHGGDTEKYLGEADAIRAPMLMHLADEDEFISKAAQGDIKAARHGGTHYNAEAANKANLRTRAFLKCQLAHMG